MCFEKQVFRTGFEGRIYIKNPGFVGLGLHSLEVADSRERSW